MQTYNVTSGVTSTSITLHSGDILEVSSGGSATHITVDNGGIEYVYSGGTAVSTTVNNGGKLQVYSTARASFTTATAGGTEFVLSGGIAISTTLNNGGGEQVYSTASASFTTVNEDSTEFVFSGGTAISTTLNNGSAEQVYATAKANITIANSGSNQFVFSGGSAISTTLGNDAFQQIGSDGSAISTTVSSGAFADVSSGGTASFITISSGGTENVYAGATASFATVDNGGTTNVSGKAISTTLNSGAFQNVSSGAAASFTTVNSGGTENVFAGGTAASIAVNNDGSAFVYAGGTTSLATVNSGGTEYVYQSATTISTTVKSAGTEVLFPGGTASGTTVSTGGTLVEPSSSGSGGLKIDISYDASVADAPAGFTATIAAAVDYLESLFTAPITVTIDVGYGEVGGETIDDDLGESESTGIDVSYQTLRNALLARTATLTEIAAGQNLPVNNPTGDGEFYVAYAEAEALGLSSGPGEGNPVGAIDLSNTLPFTFGTTNQVTPDTYDAFGVVEHEITEVLGRTDDLGSDGEYTPLDLFRYASPGERDLTPAAGYFSANGSDLLYEFNDPSNLGDAGDWATTVPNDSFDAFSDEGAVDPISPTDLKVMDVIGYTPTVVSCFAAGTQIATERGEVAVEAIRVGDRVQVLLGEEPTGKTFSKVIWTGRREVDCARHPHPQKVWPVRIAAGAFGPGEPHSPLFLSPDHAIYIASVLIPIKHLINGTTIAQIKIDRVTYHHIELPEHDVLLAQGLPAESFLDLKDGANYANHPSPPRLYPDFPARMWEAFGCAPLVVTGPHLEAARTLVARCTADQRAGDLAAVQQAA